jgi:hypothetical protein
MSTSAPAGSVAFAGEAQFEGNLTAFVPARGVWGEARGSRLAFATESGIGGALELGWVVFSPGSERLVQASLATDAGALALSLVTLSS